MDQNDFSYEKTRFLNILNEYGIKRVIFAKDFIFSLILAIIINSLVIHSNLEETILKEVIPRLISISGALIGLTLAGFAITVSFADIEFVKILQKAGVYKRILFMFWYTTLLTAISLISNLLTAIIGMVGNTTFSKVAMSISIFIFLYAVFAVMNVFGTVMRYGIYRGEFIARGKIK